MKVKLFSAAATSALCVFASLIPGKASAQKGTSISFNAPDSVSFVVDRRPAARGEPSIQTLDRDAALVLRDTVIVLQLTDYGLDHMFDGDASRKRGLSGFFVRMAKAGMSELLDHGIAYRLSSLRRAYADGNRLVLEDRAGENIFDGIEVNGRNPMEHFSRDDARRFAAEVQRAIRQSRR